MTVNSQSQVSRPQADRIAIIRPSALGDVCRTVAVLASLRAAYPDAQIDWVVQDDYTPAIAAHPALDEPISFPRGQFARWWRTPAQFVRVLSWFKSLRKRRYDLVLDCQGLGRSGLMTRATRAAQRVGLRNARELAWLGYNVRVPRDSGRQIPVHTVDQMLLLVQELGIEPLRDMRLYAAAEDRAWWHDKRSELGIADARYAVLAPTGRWPGKRWPIDRFSQLIEPLLRRGFERIVVIGAPNEGEQVRPLLDRFAGNRSPIVDLIGTASIGRTMAVVADAALVVANDSAPLHLAVGFDRPCVGLFGPTDPAVVGPYQRERSAIRGYCPQPGESITFKSPKLGDRLMRLISTASVIERIDEMIAHHRSRGRDRAKPRASGTSGARASGASGAGARA
ncbi:MAG: glycosyltransferase family 9 protein [Phycisphaerales bacterium]|nr:glycosyltransferase family 9 protein [Phycisphaerales bacterium]